MSVRVSIRVCLRVSIRVRYKCKRSDRLQSVPHVSSHRLSWWTGFARTLPGTSYGVHRVHQKGCPIRPMRSHVWVLWHNGIAILTLGKCTAIPCRPVPNMGSDAVQLPSWWGTWVPVHYCIHIQCAYSKKRTIRLLLTWTHWLLRRRRALHMYSQGEVSRCMAADIGHGKLLD